MRINEQWKQLRKELNDMYDGIKITEGQSILCSDPRECKGPHVTLMIPAKSQKTCPHCNSHLEYIDIPNPSEDQVNRLMWVIDKYLCRISWDKRIKYDKWSGEHVGWFYQIIFDKLTD